MTAARPYASLRSSAPSRDGGRYGAPATAGGSFSAPRSKSGWFVERVAAGPSGRSPAGRACAVLMLLAVPAAAAAQEPPRPAASPAPVVGVAVPDAPCVQVEVGGARVGHLDCASQALQAAARAAQAEARAPFDVTVPEAGSPDASIGVSSLSGARLRLGPALGVSVRRPTPPRGPAAARPGGGR